MDDIAYQVGVGGLVAVLLVREILGFLKHRNGSGHSPASHGDTAVSQALQLERWKAVEEAIRASTHTIRNNTQVLDSLAHHIVESRQELKEAMVECRASKRTG